MNSLRNSLIGALALCGALLATSAPASAQGVPFDECVVVSDNFGSACTTVIDGNGDQWLPDVDLSSFAIGDTIRITGMADTGCFHFCFVLEGCIFGASINPCAPPETGTPFCFGNGGDGQGCTDCPCGNNAAPGTEGGCLNGNGTSAQLVASGTAEVGNDSLHFDMLAGNSGTFAILVSADNQLPAMGMCPPGSGIISSTLDGLRCVGGNLLRHGTRATDSNGDVGLTNNGWGPPDNPVGGLLAANGFVAGQTRHFQSFYREFENLVCMTGQNTTNGVSVTFGP